MTKKNKEGIIIITVLGVIITLLIFILINSIRVYNIKYKWFKGEEIGITKECYVDEKYGCMCLIDDAFRPVDSYYQE